MAKTDGKVIATIEVDIDTALNFLESQFSDPEVRWGELRSLIAKQKAAEQSRALDASGCSCGSKDDHHTVACYLGKDERQ